MPYYKKKLFFKKTLMSIEKPKGKTVAYKKLLREWSLKRAKKVARVKKVQAKKSVQ